MKKNPWVAAILNLIISGAGYIYVGKRVLFGIMLILTDLIGVTWYYTNPLAGKFLNDGRVILTGILFLFALAYDGYQDAKSA